MAAWVVWLIIAVVLGGAEIFTGTAVLGLLGGAALITSGAAVIGLPVSLQALVFVVVAMAGLLIMRPIASRHRQLQLERFGVEALLGQEAYVVEQVTGRAGTVRLGGEEWTARSLDDSIVIPPGTTVNVFQIDGATAVVYPKE